ncbi:RNA 3'-terminal phosphate cyclase [Auriscalpium vulgare]|uniref:RNA 3'-terminal phosphate cyclase n=1 Tax=Auriscalpium vulgare TaxID=40419 RepID=A0ACB8RWG3_9AGAM|nr:RNA 3'-terminal phosphate cyclase [Auriscalpium vulgare]
MLASKVIEGNVLEGGGQLLRNTVALSALLQAPVRVDKIRNGRRPPGLKNQHVAGLRLVADMSCAHLSGDSNGSESIVFEPGPIQLPGSFHANPGTAASTALLLQIALPCLLFSVTSEPSTLTLHGGTNAAQAPQIDYTQHVFLPFLRTHFGLAPDLRIHKRGYFPKGGGTISLSLRPVTGPLPPIVLADRGNVTAVYGRAYVAGLPVRLAHDMRDAAVRVLTLAGIDRDIIDVEAVREKHENAQGSGSGIVLWAETENGCIIGGSALGSKSMAAAVVGEVAAGQLRQNLAHGGCVDEYMQDQMIIFLALAEGRSSVKTGPLTMHTRTAIWVAEQMTKAKFEIATDSETACALITCEGMGFTSRPQVNRTEDVVAS